MRFIFPPIYALSFSNPSRMNARADQSAEQLRSAIEEARDAGVSEGEIAKAETRLKTIG